MKPTTDSLKEFDQLVENQVNTTLGKGSLTSAFLGFSSSVLLYIASALNLVEHIDVPILWTLVGGTYSSIVYLLVRNGKLKNRVVHLVMFGFVSLPSTIYLIAIYYLPAGAATYVNGPPSYLYFFLIIVTGFAFNFRLSFYSGIFAGIQYSIVLYLSVDNISLIHHPDLMMQQDNRSIIFYYFRPIMMVISGYTIALIGHHVRTLISETIKKEKETELVNRIFGEYVSPEVREKVMQEKVALLGEKKSVAILFCDIRGFTTVSENKAPEEIVFELNEYFNVMVIAIAKASGTIDKFIGDAIMAVFGGVVGLENPCTNALEAALGMVENLKILNENRELRGLPRIRSGIGLHFGEVFIGAIGSENRKDYTVIGDTVNTASRIESLSKEHKITIIMSEKFFLELPDYLKNKCYFLADALLKGKKEQIKLYSYNSAL